MLTVKGGRAHRLWGQIYFWAMAVVAVTAVALALWRPQIFLALLAVFSFYMAFSGYRAVSRKRPGQGAGALDWTAALVTIAVSAALIVLGLVRPGPSWERLGIVPVVFGALGTTLAGLDIVKLVRPPADRRAWWFGHMAGMLGSYIATVSAFSVVNSDEVGGQLGRRKLELVVEDYQTRPDVALTKIRKLVERDQAKAIVGLVLSAAALAVKDYVNAQRSRYWSRASRSPRTSRSWNRRGACGRMRQLQHNGVSVEIVEYDAVAHAHLLVHKPRDARTHFKAVIVVDHGSTVRPLP